MQEKTRYEKLMAVIREIVYLDKLQCWKILCSCIAWTVFCNTKKKNSIVAYYYVQLSGVKLNNAYTTWNNQQQ